MKLIPVFYKGKIHRFSEAALELLGLEKSGEKDVPIAVKKLPPDLAIIKIQKKEVPKDVLKDVPKEPVVEVKKKEDVIVESTNVKRKRNVGAKK